MICKKRYFKEFLSQRTMMKNYFSLWRNLFCKQLAVT
jgi:hypothetical protein